MDDLALAASLVRDAGTLAARMLAEGVSAQRKTSVSDIVTAADHAAEELIGSRLAAERPSDGVVGEEGTSRPGARTWYVDPVDGTYNFLSGLPEWCSAVALVENDQPVIGAVYQPVTDELWVGGPEHRTTLNGVQLPLLQNRPLSEVSIATYLHPTTIPDDSVRRPLSRVVQGAATVRVLGSGSIELASVASGRLGAYIQYDCLQWDWYPGAALVLGAGGTTDVTTTSGRRWHSASSERSCRDIVTLLGMSSSRGSP